MYRGIDDIFWVLPGRLAGMSHPGSSRSAVGALRRRGIGALVSLTERPLNAEVLDREGMEYLHLPVRDYSAPSRDQMECFVDFCDVHISQGDAVGVHCMAGIGRTGVMLACYLVHHESVNPYKAIVRIRRLRPGALESAEQENAVYEFAAVKGHINR